MIEILLKIDDKNDVACKTCNENITIRTQLDSQDEPVGKPVIKRLRRTVDDFMYRDMQYVRAGDNYIEISPHDKMTIISRAKYYNIRKKANSYEIQ